MSRHTTITTTQPGPTCDAPACHGNIRETGIFAVMTFYSKDQGPSMLRWCNQECLKDWLVGIADIIRERPNELGDYIPYISSDS